MYYYSIKQESTSELIIKKSKFLTTLVPVKTIQDVETIRSALREHFPAANHYCYAYILRTESRTERCSDDGEPSGTAGMPMLKVLKSNELEDVLAVVVRYFGGTLLGAGGLIRAYSEAVSTAAAKSGRQRFTLCQEILLTVEYNYLGIMQNRLLNSGNLMVNHINYSGLVEIDIFIPLELLDDFVKQVVELTNDSILIESFGQKYIVI